MPNKSRTELDAEPVDVSPVASGGVNMATAQSMLPPGTLSEGYNVRTAFDVLSRRPGAAKVSRLVSAGASKTFGADTRYATIAAASQLLIPSGGWWMRMSFTAVRPSGGNTAFVLSAKPSGAAYNVVKVTLSDAGVVTVTWRDTGGTDRTVAASAVAAGAIVHLLAIADPVAGTFTVYVNGSSSGTPITGLASTQPIQTVTNWVLGVEKETGGAVTANTHFDGALDAVTLGTLTGLRAAVGETTFASVLARHSSRQWPSPQQSMILFNYDMDGSSLTTLTDSSRFKNHAAVTGTITSTAAVAHDALCGNHVETFEGADGALWNTVACAGSLFYERIRRPA